MSIGSIINPLLTLEYMQTENENKYFDRKSSRIRPVDLAQHISAFANADGGTLVIGISDKKRTLEGINSCGAERINEFINAPKDCCRPMPRYQEEFIDITNEDGEPDHLLLLHIEPSVDRVIRTSNDRTYLRIGDKSKEMLGENLRNLEYAKGSRHFEDELHPYATFDDLDKSLIDAYKERIGAADVDSHQVMKARGFVQDKDGTECLTNAAVLLFAENILKFNMNCRIRFIRIDGREMQVGDKYNVVKDKSIDEPILRLVNAAKAFIADQLRSFTRQEHGSGRFVDNPEYPEFPWVEGIINAVAHRDYAASGQFILVRMFDDRLEIESPGRFPDIVTADNITHTRFSRNKSISRVMTEFEWVREVNEGVKKIYADMAEAGLPAPEFVEMPNTVKLILRNNIDERLAYRNKDSNRDQPKTPNRQSGGMDGGLAERIVTAIRENNNITVIEISESLEVPKRTIEREIKKLRESNRIIRVGGNRYGHWQIND